MTMKDQLFNLTLRNTTIKFMMRTIIVRDSLQASMMSVP